MSEEYGNDYVVLTDENGVEVELEHLDTVEYNDNIYMAFIPAEMKLEESYELIIMKVEKEDGEDILVTLDDEDELDRVYDYYMELADAEEEAEEE